MTSPQQPTGSGSGAASRAASPSAPSPSTGRGRRVVGRLAAGIVAVTAGAALLLASLLPLPGASTEPRRLDVVPALDDLVRVCPGPLQRLSDEAGQNATLPSLLGQAAVTYAAVGQEAVPAQITEAATGTATATVLSAAIGEEETILSGSQSQQASGAEFSGTAAAECIPAGTESWLVGGATTVGRTTLLVLNNPGDVAAEVTLSFYTESGEAAASGSRLTIAPNQQSVSSLAAYLPETASPVVRVQTTTGTVTAQLQQSVVRVLEPGGIDWVSSQAAPALAQVIPHAVLGDLSSLSETAVDESYADLGATLRVLPVQQGATVRVRVTLVPVGQSLGRALAENGEEPEAVEGALPASLDVELAGGIVHELSLDQPAPGNYAVVVESSGPVVTSLRSVTAEIGSRSRGTVRIDNDFAWFAPVASLPGQSLVSVPQGPAPVLHLFNAGQEEATATLVDTATGQTSAVTVPAGSGAVQPLEAEHSYRIEASAPLHAGLSLSAADQLAATTVTGVSTSNAAVTVFR